MLHENWRTYGEVIRWDGIGRPLEHQKDRKSKCAFVYVSVCVCLFCLYDRNEIRGYGLLSASRGFGVTLVISFFPFLSRRKLWARCKVFDPITARRASRERERDGTYRVEVRTRGSECSSKMLTGPARDGALFFVPRFGSRA